MTPTTPATLLDAESQLFKELYPTLRRFAAAVAPIEIEPDDLLQEAVTRALRRGPLTELGNPGAYLRRAMVNLASNQRRQLSRMHRAYARIATSGATGGDVYPSDLNDLMRLRPQERAVLYLSEVEGYRYAEIAQLLHCTEAAARKRAVRGRRRLFAAVVGEVTDG